MEVRGPLMGRVAERNNRSSDSNKEIGGQEGRDDKKGYEVEHKNQQKLLRAIKGGGQ